MSIPDPIPTLTVNSVAYDFVRTGSGDATGVFKTADGLDRLTIAHTEKARRRSVIRLDRTAIADDPLITGNSFEAAMATYVVMDRHKVFTAAEADWHLKLLSALLLEGTPDYSLRVLRGES